MFVPSDVAEASAAIIKRDVPLPNAFPRIERRNFLVKTRADANAVEARAGDLTRATTAIESGANVVATDYPVSDAALGPYVVDLPGTAVARCNPVTAPRWCRDPRRGERPRTAKPLIRVPLDSRHTDWISDACRRGRRHATVVGADLNRKRGSPEEVSSARSFQNQLRLPPRDSTYNVRPPTATVKSWCTPNQCAAGSVSERAATRRPPHELNSRLRDRARRPSPWAHRSLIAAPDTLFSSRPSPLVHQGGATKQWNPKPGRTASSGDASERIVTEPASCDVFVIFGITGDLARVMTFRSLYRLEQRELARLPDRRRRR